MLSMTNMDNNKDNNSHSGMVTQGNKDNDQSGQQQQQLQLQQQESHTDIFPSQSISHIALLEERLQKAAAQNSSPTPTKNHIQPKTFFDTANLRQEYAQKYKAKVAAKLKQKFPFWDTQPVINTVRAAPEPSLLPLDGPIHPDTPADKIRQIPLLLPEGFEWFDVDITDDAELTALYSLLNRNYVEDDEAMFRFDYSPEFLKWALQPVGWKRSWHAGIRLTATKKMMAFIAAVPIHMQVHSQSLKMVEINFLCVHKKLRSKRLAPVLIKEITRRAHVEGIFQAVYTAGKILPSPVASCRYYHRSLNVQKLIETGFSPLPRNRSLADQIKLYELPDITSTAGLRLMEEKDVDYVHYLLNNYLSQFSLHPIFTREDVLHWFLPRKNVIHTYVVEEAETGLITDFLSFYVLPSTCVGHPVHSSLKIAYAFYGSPEISGNTQLTKDALILAKREGCDVYNCVEVMKNVDFIDELKFGPGDGTLNYYLFNWSCQPIKCNKVGFLML